MSIEEELQKLRQEAKKLRQDNATVSNAWEHQKDKNKGLDSDNKKLRKELGEAQREIKKLTKILESIKNHKDALVKIIFKSKGNKKESERKRGGQICHKGHGRKKPKQADKNVEVYLSHCPHCNTELNASNSSYERVVEDIPEVEIKKVIITRYTIQRQWCPHCQKEVHAEPENTLTGFRIGLNAIGLMLFLKYNQRLPLAKISESLKCQYSLKIKEAGIQNILNQLKNKFQGEYEKIIEKVRENRLKHADETGWRIDGGNGWCWLFKTPKDVCYVIEETRGKGIAEKVLGKNPKGVLVRDDYAVYQKLDMEQQSCWSHLLRNSHDLAEKESASREIKDLHKELKNIFDEVSKIIEEPFSEEKRKEYHDKYHVRIFEIIGREYESQDVKKIQTRITNQGDNLITAILHEGVPLTNNSAERQIRQVAVARKISGGSRSKEGARTQAVNMSITQTLALQGKSIFKGLKSILQTHSHRFSLEKTE
ncbi:MAG: IS66 family transposase [bacterium]